MADEWLEPELRAYYDQLKAEADALEPDGVVAYIEEILERHRQWVDRSCITLYAGTNVMNPRVSALLASTVGTRPSMGPPGAKYQTGLRFIERIEVAARELAKRLFQARYAETRVYSGSMANGAVYQALCRVGDTIMVLPPEAGGHPSHGAEGFAGFRGLRVEFIPWDEQEMNVDVDAFRVRARTLRPRLVIVGGSLVLFPYPLADIRAVADEVGAAVMYDAAHLAGIIAGGRFQAPLAEGADVMTMSTYKTFGGPPGGLIVTNRPDIAQAVERAVYPGMTANYDASRVAALAAAAADLLAFGADYARRCLENARALAAALDEEGFRVLARHKGFTRSHHVALDARPLGGARGVAARLEQANILLSGIAIPGAALPGDFNGIRIGVQEVTRWGMGPQEMAKIAWWMRRVVLDGEDPSSVSGEVAALRRSFQRVEFCFQ